MVGLVLVLALAAYGLCSTNTQISNGAMEILRWVVDQTTGVDKTATPTSQAKRKAPSTIQPRRSATTTARPPKPATATASLKKTTTPSVSPTPAPSATPAPPAAWYRIYFTQPTCAAEPDRHGGVDEIIAADLRKAKRQVDIAAFELDSQPIVDALIELNGRKVVVRAVTDTDNADMDGIRRLRRHGISVVEDKRNGFMHNKFIVIDGRYVWTGSLNFSSNGVYCNNNNTVRFDSKNLAANYTSEMDEMYEDHLFGPDSPNTTPYNKLRLQGVEVENYFAPEKQLVTTLARTLARAQTEILFLSFTFTSPEIGETMLGRAEAGVDVRGVFETLGSESEFSYFTIAARQDLPHVHIKRDGNQAIMHHKVFIIDRQTVIFGSFNFTDSANRRNDENVVIVHDPAFAAQFAAEFERIWAASVTR